MVLNKIHIENTLSENDYMCESLWNESLCFPDLVAKLANNKRSKLEKMAPFVFIVQRRAKTYHKLKKLTQNISGIPWDLTRIKNVFVLTRLSIRYFYFINPMFSLWLKCWVIYQTVFFALVRDVKLNWQIRRGDINKV